MNHQQKSSENKGDNGVSSYILMSDERDARKCEKKGTDPEFFTIFSKSLDCLPHFYHGFLRGLDCHAKKENAVFHFSYTKMFKILSKNV